MTGRPALDLGLRGRNPYLYHSPIHFSVPIIITVAFLSITHAPEAVGAKARHHNNSVSSFHQKKEDQYRMWWNNSTTGRPFPSQPTTSGPPQNRQPGGKICAFPHGLEGSRPPPRVDSEKSLDDCRNLAAGPTDSSLVPAPVKISVLTY